MIMIVNKMEVKRKENEIRNVDKVEGRGGVRRGFFESESNAFGKLPARLQA